MTRAHVEQLLLQMERANKRLRERLEGINDDEYLWEPVANYWTVRRRETATSARPDGRGEWVFDIAEEQPRPPPFTTIAWRPMHLVDVMGGYFLVLWGEISDTWMEVPPSAVEGIALWEYHATNFARNLALEDDASLKHPIRVTTWPESTPRWRVVSNVATEAIHHGAEIGVLRDLYGRRDELRP